ncbi:hypothetical protein [Streptomyces sp. NPDC086777]|uniref:hypothetical protein n=1 Tax=Streptomyces sp. NPDC086777 TaxID=3154866 RepID=UPI00344EB505
MAGAGSAYQVSHTAATTDRERPEAYVQMDIHAWGSATTCMRLNLRRSGLYLVGWRDTTPFGENCSDLEPRNKPATEVTWPVEHGTAQGLVSDENNWATFSGRFNWILRQPFGFRDPNRQQR